MAAKNYLAQARVCCGSFLEHHPGARAFVLLADRIDGCFDPDAEPFEVIEARRLGVPDFVDLSFRYDLLELNTALKPFFMRHLLERAEVERLVYLDPDTFVYRPFWELARALDSAAIVVTPHLLRPLEGDERGTPPDEKDILAVGAYNLGFLAVARGAETDRFLSWWWERLREECFSDPGQGPFTDQKWIDLVGAFFPGASVLRHRGYNVAHWNLHERLDVSRSAEGPVLSDGPLAFFHFSGFDPKEPRRMTHRRLPRYEMKNLPPAYRDVFADYVARLKDAGWEASRSWPYAYGSFSDGMPIPRVARRLYHGLGAERRRFEDPFRSDDPDGFLAWLLEPAVRGSLVSHLLLHLWRGRPDLQAVFPDPCGASMAAFLEWATANAAREFALPIPLGASFERALNQLRGARDLSAVDSTPPSGVNLFAYLDTENGVGEVGRSLVRMLRHAGIAHAALNVEQPWLRRNDRTIRDVALHPRYAVDLVVVNANHLAEVLSSLGLRKSPGRRLVAYLFWELTTVPPFLREPLKLFDEIWVASEFCRQAVASAGSVPVHLVRPAVEVSAPGATPRSGFGLRGSDYVFLSTFDSASIPKRKNPSAVVSAFRQAFRPEEPASLVLKTMNATPRQTAALERLAGRSRVTIWNRYLDRGELLDLVSVCDAYISLHRSEGLGLGPLEALLLGKPILATDYGGVREYLDAAGSARVPYRLEQLRRDLGPYPKGSVWAEADVCEAARLMRQLYESRRQDDPERPADSLRSLFGIDSTTAILEARLKALFEEIGPNAASRELT